MADKLQTILRIKSKTTNLRKNAIQAVFIDGAQKKVNIIFRANANNSVISEKTLAILRGIGESSGNYNINITSTARTPYDQARVMYQNIVKNGQQFIDVYERKYKSGKRNNQFIKAMEAKIKQLGPLAVSSKHCANHNKINVFDMGVNSFFLHKNTNIPLYK